MTTRELHRLLRVAIEATHRAGRLVLAHTGRPRTIQTKRHAVDLVTEVDRASERILHRAIQRAFPHHGFQGEERTRTNPASPYQWIVDPIDGTTNFVHGVPTFGISMGLWHGETPIVGVIYDPTRDETFTAITGHGARLNGRRMRVSRVARLGDALLSTGFSERFRDDPEPFVRWFTAFQLRCHGVRRVGSTTISLAQVACGRQDGFYEQDLWPWDIAAGILLVQEAGGRVTNFHGRPVRLSEGRLVASNGAIHPQMLTVLRRASR